MRIRLQSIALSLLLCSAQAFPANTIPANNPYIQYYGRWDFSDPAAPAHSWPGVSVYAEFEGTSIKVSMNDNYCYYNVVIDDTIRLKFKGTFYGVGTYPLASNLADGRHSIRLTKRNETNWTKFTFNGFVLDDGKNLVPPRPRPARKIEFIGDSFTSASGNEWIDNTVPSDQTLYTNIDEGFGPIIARHYGAQFQMTSESGFGLIQDWQGNSANNLPDVFDRALTYANNPKWDFEQWVPNLVVICLGLNDYSGWHGYDGPPLTQDKRDMFEARYHGYIAWIRSLYPGTKILAVAAHPDWIRTSVSEVVAQEKTGGHNDVSYAWFPYYPGGYVNSGHPSVATHHKIADTLIAVIDTITAWEVHPDTIAPAFVHLPATPFTVCDTAFSLSLQTDEYAVVRYSTQDKPYDAMEFLFAATGKRMHSTVLTGMQGGHYTFYARGADAWGNAMRVSAVIRIDIDTTKAPIAWKSPAFDAAGWKSGPGPFTDAPSGAAGSPLAHVATAYFRKSITIDNVDSTGGLTVSVTGNDGGTLFLNGNPVLRINISGPTELPYDLYAAGPRAAFTTTIPMTRGNAQLDRWRSGQNIVAFEMHQGSGNSRISFDAKVAGSDNKTYCEYGSDWLYYDAGDMPRSQTGDRATGIAASGGMQPESFSLSQNYPNPFNPATVVRYRLPGAGAQYAVSLAVYDLLGREVAALARGVESSGVHQVTWDASRWSSGTYFIRLTAHGAGGGLFTQTVKALLLK